MEASFFTEYMPHGYCYAWQPTILWMSVLSDLAIFLSYFSIPIALILIVKKRSDLKFKGIVVLFAAFILLCGITHAVSIYTIWFGNYGLHALAKMATAIVSVLTAVVVFLRIETALKIPSLATLKEVSDEAVTERIRRIKMEHERRSDAIFKFTTQMVPTGLLVIDESQRIRLANQAAEEMFGYSSDEINGMELTKLIDLPNRGRHRILVDNYLKNTHSTKNMAAGRVVTGRTKSGNPVSVEIKISVNDYENERYAFANITDIGRTLNDKDKQLQNSERVVRAIEATNDGVWEWNIQTDEVWYSKKLMALIGKPDKEQADINDWKEHIHPDDKTATLKVMAQHFSSKERCDIVYRGHVGEGRYEWMHMRGDTIFDNRERPLLMTGTLTNVHEIKTMRETLDQKSRFLEQVLSHSMTGMYVFNLESYKNTYINPEYTKLCGWALEDLNAIQDREGSLIPLFHPEDRDAVIKHFDNVASLKESEGVGIEYRFQHKNGHWVWCYSRDSILNFSDDGKPHEILGAFFDISDIKQREEEVLTLAINFSSTFDQAAVGMAMIGLDGRFNKVNTKLCEMLGYSEAELLNVGFSDITFPDDIDNSVQNFKRINEETSQHLALEKRYVKRDGSIIWARVTIAMVVNERGEKSHFVSVIDDISNRVRIENELAASNASLERFAYSASHDLQEPLRKISAFAGLLEERLDGKLEDKEAVFQLNRISDASKRMGEMIQKLLELSRFSRARAEKHSCTLSSLVSQVIDDISPRIRQSNANIELLDDVEINVEKNSFEQVLRNLFVNSILYCKKDQQPKITIRPYKKKGSIEIHVQDNGIGFDKKFENQIFEPFRRLVPRDIQGTGMGLAICKQIMRSHDGDILAKSKQDGALFIIVLPHNTNELRDEN